MLYTYLKVLECDNDKLMVSSCGRRDIDKNFKKSNFFIYHNLLVNSWDNYFSTIPIISPSRSTVWKFGTF